MASKDSQLALVLFVGPLVSVEDRPKLKRLIASLMFDVEFETRDSTLRMSTG